METIYFKCTLLTDVVLNASLATEGNMESLDHIPGSNFLGIVANSVYQSKGENPDFCYELFHSNEVSFGDALIVNESHQSYALPFSLYCDKLKKDITKERVWVHHYLNKDNHPKDEINADKNIQLKQHRGGFFNSKGDYFKEVERTFALKSAYNRSERRSKEGAMFGFNSIRKGQVFLFSVLLKNDNHKNIIIENLEGTKRIGKSKSAQYGQVEIEEISTPPKTFSSISSDKKQLIIYAESNLCFFNEYGYNTFRPSVSAFGLKENDATINWEASQVRTYSYSPWNTKRNTSNTQRDCILRGSVLVLGLKKTVNISELKRQVGGYNMEGLGRVLYNPEFLKADQDGLWQFKIKDLKTEIRNSKTPVFESLAPKTSLAILLKAKQDKIEAELEIGKAIIEFIKQNKFELSDVSSSQWGGIRAKALLANHIDTLKEDLFGIDETIKEGNLGFLMNGVAAEKYWDKNKGKKRQILLEALKDNRKLGTPFIAKLATEMAKIKQQQK